MITTKELIDKIEGYLNTSRDNMEAIYWEDVLKIIKAHEQERKKIIFKERNEMMQSGLTGRFVQERAGYISALNWIIKKFFGEEHETDKVK